MQENNATEAAYGVEPLSGAVAAGTQGAILSRALCVALHDDLTRPRTRSLPTPPRRASN
jgi:hypothetical protein